MKPRVAVLLPCHNEALTIAKVVADFRENLPNAEIYVYDNRSTDNTAEEARAAGAIVRYEPQPGKGSVVRRMFADIDADVYVIADGDGTYESAATPHLIDTLFSNQLDMVVGTRRSLVNDTKAYRPGHRGGNLFLTTCIKLMFDARLSDLLSGYRIFSRRFVKSFPALSNGFEIETELAVHALELQMPFTEVPTLYSSRPEGSVSKLKTFTDGWRILGTALLLFKEVRPFLFFGIIFLILLFVSLVLGVPVVLTFLETSLVPRFPTAILAASIGLLSFISLTCGIVLDSVARGRRESKRMTYLSYSVPTLSFPLQDIVPEFRKIKEQA
ncbi:MAG: glycosyltransferase [Cyanobacteria bacterium SID2]|nr:glycosyltransferase [Cyanobacteria bacterium SID2]